MLEMVAISFDGAHTAERQLRDLRSSRKDEWLAPSVLLPLPCCGDL